MTKPDSFLQAPVNNKFFIYMSSFHVNEAIKKGLFWILKFHMSAVNPCYSDFFNI